MKILPRPLLAALSVILLLLTGCTPGSGEAYDPSNELTYEKAVEQVNAHLDPKDGDVRFSSVTHLPDPTWPGQDTTAEDLPKIETFPLRVTGKADIVVEIASSTEKSKANEEPGWLDRMAEEFNAADVTVDGKSVAVSTRPLASGLALAYMRSGVYVPQAYSPANELWMPMIEDAGISAVQVADRLTGNTAGVLMKEEAHKAFVEKHGAVTVPSLVQAVTDGEMRLGHTDPNVSSTGLNWLLEELKVMDPVNPVSDTAAAAYQAFNADALKPSLTTKEMTQVAAYGLMDAMIMESQAWKETAELATGWVFVPVGVRHDSPLYAMDRLGATETEVLRLFADFVQTDKAQAVATKLGFNQYNEYPGVKSTLNGAQISGALKLWKANKDGGASIISVIVVDRSDSMKGDKLRLAKLALLAGANEISLGSHVGLVSYGSDVTVDLPIAEWSTERQPGKDADQRSLYTGAVNALQTRGGTATNSAIIVALHLILEYQKGLEAADSATTAGNYKYRIILISDGQRNEGVDVNAARRVIGGLGASVSTISFETDSVLDELELLSRVGSEAASVSYATSANVRTVFRDMTRNAL